MLCQVEAVTCKLRIVLTKRKGMQEEKLNNKGKKLCQCNLTAITLKEWIKLIRN